MDCSIVGLGTAVPPDAGTQEALLQISQDIVCENDRHTRLAQMMFRKAEIETRRCVFRWQQAYEWKKRPDVMDPGNGPRTGERMELYAKLAGPLAARAALRALEDAQTDPADITHLMTVSCTGFADARRLSGFLHRGHAHGLRPGCRADSVSPIRVPPPHHRSA